MVYIRGDTHGDLSCFCDEQMPGQSGWTSADKLIVTGDFGFVFSGYRAERSNLDELARKPYEILFLDGNHENFDLLEKYPEEERYGAPVRRIRDNIFWLQRGYLYTIEDHTFFVMGGGYSIDKAWRLNYEKTYGDKIWFLQEMPSPEEYHRAIVTLEDCGMKMDYILTHTAPRTIIPRVICKTPDPHEDELNGFLDWIYHEAEFKSWYFGHFHMDMHVNDQMVACFERVHQIGGNKMTVKEWNFEAIKWMYDLGWTPEEVVQLSRLAKTILSNPAQVKIFKENTKTLQEFLPRDDVFMILNRCNPPLFHDQEEFRKRWSDVYQMLGDDFRDVVLRHIRELKNNILHAILLADDEEWEDFMDRLFLFSMDLYMIEE